MARKPRIQFAGATLHVWARRVDRWPLFIDDEDYERYVALLAKTVTRFDWKLLSFCLMPNHVHHMIELREPNLDRGMKCLHGPYVQQFNQRHGRDGGLFEDRYKSRLVTDELYFLTLIPYIERNPVRARLCATPEDWRWSSRGLMASGREVPWLADATLQARRKELKGGV